MSVLRSLFLSVAACLAGACALAQQVTVVPVPATGLVYDATTRKLYACVGSSGQGTLANSIVSIDPLTGAVGTPVYVGSEPRHLVRASGGKYLYVAVSDGTSVRRFDLATQKPGPQFPVGQGIAVTAMLPMPGNPDAVIVMRHTPGISPNDAGVAIYENGTPRSATVNAGHSMAFGVCPTRLYGYENQISSFGLTTMNLTANGVAGAGTAGGVISGNVAIQGANGLLYTDNGSVVDPEAHQVVGKLPGLSWGSVICPDPTTGRVFQLSGERDSFKLTVFDMRTFASYGSIPITGIGGNGGPGGLMRWGEDGLAFTAGDRIVLLRGQLGPKVPQVDVSVKRSTMPAVLTPEAQVSYTLTVANTGTTAASGVFLTEALPSGVDVLEAKASQGNAVTSGGVMRADLGDLAAGASATVKLTVKPGSAGGGGFTAVVRANEPDSAPDNNLSIVGGSTATAALPDLTGTWERLQQASRGSGVNLRATVVGAFVVRNVGKRPSRPCAVRFYLSEAMVFRPEFGQLIEEVSIPAIPVGAAYRTLLEAPLGAGDDATGLFVYAVIDPTQQNQEADRANNAVRQKIP